MFVAVLTSSTRSGRPPSGGAVLVGLVGDPRERSAVHERPAELSASAISPALWSQVSSTFSWK